MSSSILKTLAGSDKINHKKCSVGHIALGGQYLGIHAGQFGFRLGGWIEGQDQNCNLKPNLDAEVANKTPKSTPDFYLAKNINFNQKSISPKFSPVLSLALFCQNRV